MNDNNEYLTLDEAIRQIKETISPTSVKPDRKAAHAALLKAAGIQQTTQGQNIQP